MTTRTRRESDDPATVEAFIERMRTAHPVESNLDFRLAGKMRRRAGHGADVRPASVETTHRQLQRFLSERIAEPFTVSAPVRLSGGGANESYGFTLSRGERTDELVLRVKAPAGICVTEVEREFTMLQATHGVIPVPEPYWMTTDPSVFGQPALICGRVPGVPSPTKDIPKATGLGTAYGSRLRAQLAPQFIRYLARLHAHDWSQDDLAGFDIPRPDTTDSVDWRLALWNRSWDEDALEAHPTVLLARHWLVKHRPIVDRVSLLHGDYRNGNFIFDEDTGRITAVLDWELAHLGDRHSDLAYAMLPGWGHYDEAGRYLNSGLVDTKTLINEYERISGLSVDQERLDYYIVLNLYWAVVALIGTGPRNADAQLTQLDVMYNVIAGLGGFFIGELNRLLAKD
jgi:aminoglycoside phosphotransferase (APT) family kinase protein